MARSEVVTITNMCMVYDGNKVLVQDKKDDDYAGITFPGDHVEKGESFTDAVIREVYKENGHWFDVLKQGERKEIITNAYKRGFDK